MRADELLPAEMQALDHLIQIAQGDTGQSRRVADFLLAWWNAGECGAFDLTTAWGVDDVIAEDMVTVFRLIMRARSYPDALGYRKPFDAIVRAWRPELITE
ncbi:hypothetical protein [Burkholderia ubonensis]|uniref:DUF7673 family protein n=1 Tax=Burkholderia ubonensis TaxID=101571 RepID=UPI00075B1ADA|nr:hypothetical protein [Burkholderia ubonensis]KVW81386.1 hypothetical protein WK99_22065 [Burkholderia ubonensis]